MQNNTDEQGTVATLEAPARKAPTTSTPERSPVRPSVDDFDQDEPTGFQKWRAPIIVGILTCAGIGFAANLLSKKGGASAPNQQTTTVSINVPPPPAPPPPPPPPPPETQKQPDQIEEAKQPEQTPEQPTPAVATNIKGPGSSDGISAGNTRGPIGGGPKFDAEQARWGAYATQAAAQIKRALGVHPRTKKFEGRFDIRVWFDTSGRIIRAELNGSTGDKALDDAIRDEVLLKVQLSEPPPPGMHMPIKMRINGRRPLR